MLGEIFAERGYQAVIQSCRGTFGSGGQFVAFQDDERDGRATLDWIAKQSWFNGRLGMFGPSYLGHAQWALAAGAPEFLQALGIQIATSHRHESIYPGGTFALDFVLSWIHTIADEDKSVLATLWARLRDRQVLEPSFRHLPLRDADSLLGERRFQFYQDWLTRTEPTDQYWDNINFSRPTHEITANVNLPGGWYDIYIERQISDFRALRDAGRNLHLTIGPWSHSGAGPMSAGIQE